MELDALTEKLCTGLTTEFTVSSIKDTFALSRYVAAMNIDSTATIIRIIKKPLLRKKSCITCSLSLRLGKNFPRPLYTNSL